MSGEAPRQKPRARSRTKVLLYVLGGVVISLCCFAAFVVVALVQAFDTDRDLSDFASPAEARSFTSEHLPVPLPADAVVESLHYDHFTDWMLTARVRLASPAATDRYFEQTKRDRKLDDTYCGDAEPVDGARYFLSGVTACGLIERAAPNALQVRCNTR